MINDSVPIMILVEDDLLNELPDIVARNLTIGVYYIEGVGNLSIGYQFDTLIQLHLECDYRASFPIKPVAPARVYQWYW